MPTLGEHHVLRKEVTITPKQLLAVHEGSITEQGLRHNIDVGLQYLESWLSGNGCVPIYNLMEDAATAEICRAQIWQWLRHGARLSDGRQVTAEMVKSAMSEQVERARERRPTVALPVAAEILERLILAPEFIEFLTLPAYDRLM